MLLFSTFFERDEFAGLYARRAADTPGSYSWLQLSGRGAPINSNAEHKWSDCTTVERMELTQEVIGTGDLGVQ